MVDFMIPFMMGVVWTIGLIAGTWYVLNSSRGEEPSSDNFNMFVTKDEFDMLCRVVHDMSRKEDAPRGA